MKPSPTESKLQRAIRLSNNPPRALAIVMAVKRWVAPPLVLSWIVFMILMIPAGIELSFLGWAPETYWTLGGRFALPFGIVFAIMMVFLTVWLICGWILKLVGVE